MPAKWPRRIGGVADTTDIIRPRGDAQLYSTHVDESFIDDLETAMTTTNALYVCD